jgi:16S rRNA processing protein RimM
MTAPDTPSRLRAAQVVRAHGVRGEVRVEPLGGDADRFTTGLRLHVEAGDDRELTVRSSRALPDGMVLLALDELVSRTDAERLRGAYLCVDAADARTLGTDEWFVHELVGLRAVTPEGEALGHVSDVESCPGQDVLVVDDGNVVRRLPLCAPFVHRVDVPEGVIELTPWPEEAADEAAGSE